MHGYHPKIKVLLAKEEEGNIWFGGMQTASVCHVHCQKEPSKAFRALKKTNANKDAYFLATFSKAFRAY